MKNKIRRQSCSRKQRREQKVPLRDAEMGDRPQCPPVKTAQQPDPVCCSALAGQPACCVPIKEKRAAGPTPDADVLEKLRRGYERLQLSSSTSLLRKHLTRELFDRLKVKMTQHGSSLLDVVQSGFQHYDSNVGVYAPDADAYSVFSQLFDPIIAEYHGFGPTDVHPPLDWGNPGTLQDLDPENKYIRSTRVRCGRSIAGYPFNPMMTKELYKQMEKEASEVLSQLDGVHAGKYETLRGMNPRYQKQLINDHYLFKEGDRFLIAAKSCEHWPIGRGIFMNEDKTFLVWVGEEDHLRIISMQMGGHLGEVYKRMVDGVNKIGRKLSFVRHPRLGFLTFCPTNLGTTVRASVMIRLPIIGRDMAQLEALAERYNLQVRGSEGEHTASADGSYDISNKRRLGITEFQAVHEMYSGLREMIYLEELRSQL
ncbi:hypothetical protein R5R35_010504 [Gryllus longicercus]|uniref:arginine kinase n=2 Tax=Gryllus longicercus TaxID=2509291 RepID=A0AAN9VGQ0_9ORTH